MLVGVSRLAIAALLVAPLLGVPALAHQIPPGLVQPPPAVVPFVVPTPSTCWIDIRLFDTLRYGPVDFCRENLRYSPGRLECYQITDQVCATLTPDGQWVEGRTPLERQVFHCPPGPPPPVCRRLDLR